MIVTIERGLVMSEELLTEIENGEGLTLRDLAKCCPSQRGGKPVSLSCVLRWCLVGVRGPSGARVKLAAARLSGKWISSRGALRRFIEAQTPNLNGDDLTPLRPRSATKRQRASERAERELDSVGI
jgi:Protein of unknown function (DUF1580)